MTEVTKKKFESEEIMKAADKVRRTALMKGRVDAPPKPVSSPHAMLSVGKGENSGLTIYRLLLVYLLPHRVSYGRQSSGSPVGLYYSVDDGDAISAHGCA